MANKDRDNERSQLWQVVLGIGMRKCTFGFRESGFAPQDGNNGKSRPKSRREKRLQWVSFWYLRIFWDSFWWILVFSKIYLRYTRAVHYWVPLPRIHSWSTFLKNHMSYWKMKSTKGKMHVTMKLQTKNIEMNSFSIAKILGRSWVVLIQDTNCCWVISEINGCRVQKGHCQRMTSAMLIHPMGWCTSNRVLVTDSPTESRIQPEK